MNWRQVKESTNLQYYVVNTMGLKVEAGHLGGKYINVKCFMHNEQKGASLVIYKDGWKCYGGCGKGGDIFELVAAYYGCSQVEALKKLGGGDYPDTPQKVKKYVPEMPTLTRDEHDVAFALLAYREGRMKAIRYFSQYCITMETVDQFMLGYNNPEYGRSPLAGYTIPSLAIVNGKMAIKSIKIRRDDEREDMKSFPKYISIKGGDTSGPFRIINLSLPDGSHNGPCLEYLMFTEDEKTAILLTQMGYNAVSWKPSVKWEYYLPNMMKNVKRAIIIADNDPDKIDPKGKVVNAGMTYALKLKDALGDIPNNIIRPDLFNDLADMARDNGLESVRSWILENTGIVPKG